MWTKKLLIFILVITAAAVLLALFRYNVCFMPGVQGLFVCMGLGAICAQIGKNAEPIYSFKRRLRLSAGFPILFVFIQVLVVSAMHMEEGDNIFTWIGNVIDGYEEEYFFSFGQMGAINKTVSGTIEEGWWVFMHLLDAGLGALGFMTGLMIGLPSPEKSDFKYTD